MPKLLCMQRPKQSIRKPVLTTSQNGLMSLPGVGTFSRNPAHHHPYCSSTSDTHTPNQVAPSLPPPDILSADTLQAIDAVEYITDYLKDEQEEKAFRDDWKYVAMVIDRLLLYVFLGITVGGTIGIIGSSPYVLETVDQQKILKQLIYRYKNAGDL
uniref:Neurotransmitter-gated ion-channel transmembrane domain-containing protein n=1 Tax=Panagrolaimus davidi TaxID=227884 RepID=A0A914Q5M5_9BILA